MKADSKSIFQRLGILLLIAPGVWLSGCASVKDARKDQPDGDGLALYETEKVREPVNERFAEALAHFSVALTHEFQGEGSEAVAQYRLAIEKDPDNETLYLLASRRLLDAGERNEAFALMEQLLERDPDNAKALLWTAQMHLLANEEEEALTLLLRLIEADPSMEVAYLEAARLLLKDRREDEVLEVTRKGAAQADLPRRVTQLHAELLLRAAAETLDTERADALTAEAGLTLAAGRRQFPEHLPFYLLGADLAARDDDIVGMMAIYRQLDKVRGGDMETRNTILVQFVRGMRSPANAESRLRAYLGEFPGVPLAHFLQGLLHELNGRMDEAVESYERVLAANPDDIHALRKIAVILYSGGSTQRAVEVLQDGLERHPENPELLRLAGGIFLSMQNFADAENALSRLDALRRAGLEVEDGLQFRSLHAMSLLAVGKAREAVEPMVQVMRENPEIIHDIWGHQIRLAFLAEDDEDLKAEREKVLLESMNILADRLPEAPEVLRLIGRTHSFRREYAEALNLLRQTKRVAEGLENPEQWLDAEFYFDLGASLERVGEEEEAEEVFERVIRMDPNHAHALNYLAYMWAEQDRNLDTALDYVQRALRQDPNNGAYIDTRGWIYYRQGRYEQAYRDLTRAAELEPDESVIAEHVGDVLMKLGRPVEAVSYYRIALELEADDREEIVRNSLKAAEEAVSAEMARKREEARAEREAKAQAEREAKAEAEREAEAEAEAEVEVEVEVEVEATAEDDPEAQMEAEEGEDAEDEAADEGIETEAGSEVRPQESPTE
ncbi:MAG: tetratricopeptide repeat protein [Verrucomicrobia bacterium]|nr:tetratricopeptide repeat protein [Verrucomicrobiota bacterium]MCH8511690.1 tetratricopeptide repeat protein [Kiritimatiellia bacterium]